MRSTLYQPPVIRRDLVCSMSAKRSCYDNACTESFFPTLKVEAIHSVSDRFSVDTSAQYTAIHFYPMLTPLAGAP
ncbi:hypothetical protein [Halomonas korlensis]|uniref:hypothetical protein n=1 Tax=Halomonas korlensis TaxID=463301 RepID=UPI000B7FEB6C|nr:hypothetical protein [Halomonas korlensis]